MADHFRKNGPGYSGFGRLGFLVAAFLLMAPVSPRAHPVSLTVALINVKDDSITVDFSMMVEDLILYYWMESDENFRFSQELLKNQAETHAGFLLKHLHLMDRSGVPMQGDKIGIDFSDLPEEGVHIDELMAHSLVYRFEYRFTERPNFLTVAQDFGGEEPTVPSEMRARIFHHGVLMETAMLAHGSAHTVRLDWDAGWERVAEDLEGARERLRQRREETLGITSYSSVYSFIYVSDDEIRHEILVPLLTLETWLRFPRAGEAVMTVDEQRASTAEILAFFRRHNRVALEGDWVEPVLQRVQFFGPEIQDFARRAPEREVSVYSARVGVILSFPTRETPRSLTMEWDYFTERMPRLRSTFYPFEDGADGVVFTPRQTVFHWDNPKERPWEPLALVPPPESVPVLRLPLVSVLSIGLALLGSVGIWRSKRRSVGVGCAVVVTGLLIAAAATRSWAVVDVPHPLRILPPLDEVEAGALFAKLHHNLYLAFDHRDEERVYDVLEQSVAGQLLEDVYLQIRRGLEMEEQGGAVSRIRGVELLELAHIGDVSSPGRPGFAIEAGWAVTGTVEHWGHVHTRTNHYEARFIVEGLSEGWRITGFEPLREERVGMQIALRR